MWSSMNQTNDTADHPSDDTDHPVSDLTPGEPAAAVYDATSLVVALVLPQSTSDDDGQRIAARFVELVEHHAVVIEGQLVAVDGYRDTRIEVRS